MERLTIRSKNSDMVWFKDAENGNAHLEPCEMTAHHNRMALDKLATYEDAEKQGFLLRLPISEDTPVYSIEYCCGNIKSNRSGMCFRGICENCSDKAYYIRESVAKHCSICEINRSVFLTREEAEAKLKEMRGKAMYCDGRCQYLNERKHKCELTGEKLTYMKQTGSISFSVHEHRGVCKGKKVERDGE